MLGLKSSVSATRYYRGYNSETSYDAGPECANMFPPLCSAGGICARPRSASMSWRQLECWRMTAEACRTERREN
jgi:hypothetical protein